MANERLELIVIALHRVVEVKSLTTEICRPRASRDPVNSGFVCEYWIPGHAGMTSKQNSAFREIQQCQPRP
jgi:hypothetical protein